MRKIFLDFDGTLVDVSQKYVFLYRDLMRKYGQLCLTEKEYWEFKRQRVLEGEIVAKTVEDFGIIDTYLRERRRVIEDAKYLAYDKLIPGVKELLGKLAGQFDLFLLTYRKQTQSFLEEIERLGLQPYFCKSICAGFEQFPSGSIFKQRRIAAESPAVHDLVVGDTEDDIEAGKALGLKTVAVLSGIRGREFIEKMEPDYILSNVTEIFQVVR